MAGVDESEEKYNAAERQEKSMSLSDDDSIVFGGQVPKVDRQVTGLTNLEKAKTLMTLSTAGVRTSVVAPNANIGKSDYVPNTDLFNYTNPDRPPDDLNVAQNQMYNGNALNGVSRQPSQPTFSAPTAARSPGAAIQARYTRTMTWRGDGEEVLFGKYVKKRSCYLLGFSIFLAFLFGGVCISVTFHCVSPNKK